jgi:hypothetical protein
MATTMELATGQLAEFDARLDSEAKVQSGMLAALKRSMTEMQFLRREQASAATLVSALQAFLQTPVGARLPDAVAVNFDYTSVHRGDLKHPFLTIIWFGEPTVTACRALSMFTLDKEWAEYINAGKCSEVALCPADPRIGEHVDKVLTRIYQLQHN